MKLAEKSIEMLKVCADNICAGLCFSAPGFLPQNDSCRIGIAEKLPDAGTCFTVAETSGKWHFISGCGEKLYRLSLHVGPAVQRIFHAAVRKVKLYYNIVRAVMRPMVPQRLRL